MKATAIISGILLFIATPTDQAHAQVMGAIGDSISTAMDADDDCNALNTCAGKLREDWNFSWATGASLANSHRRKQNVWSDSYVIRAQRNGARWDDAAGQAAQINGASYVTIEMGGNDVCRNLGQVLPTRAEIEAHIENTFNELNNRSACGATVAVASVPRVNQLYNTMRSRPNFAFTTCQDLWDLNTSNMSMNLVEGGFCDIPFLGSLVCGAINAIGQIVQVFVNPLIGVLIQAFEVQFPCGIVLRSGSNATNRAMADTLNREINDVLAARIAAWNARPYSCGGEYGTRRLTFKWDNYRVWNMAFTHRDVSHLDCFHPSRRGQEFLAQETFNAMHATVGSSDTQTDSTPPSISTAQTWSSWWSYRNGYYQLNTSYSTTEVSKVKVYYEDCTGDFDWWCSYSSPCYLGDLNQQPGSHQFGIYPFTYSEYAYGWWAADVRLVDRAGNVSGLKYGTCI